MDREKLAKIMAMTTSDTDPEALAALRMANKLLAAEKLTWEDVLRTRGHDVKISVFRQAPGEDWVQPYLKDQVMIDLMFRAVFSQPRTGNEGFWQTMDGIHQSWLDHKVLTQSQYSALRNSYKVAVRPRA